MKPAILVGAIAFVLGVVVLLRFPIGIGGPSITPQNKGGEQEAGSVTHPHTALAAGNHEKEELSRPAKTKVSTRQEPADPSQQLERRIKILRTAVETEQKVVMDYREAVAVIIKEKKLTYPSAAKDIDVTSAMKNVEIALRRSEELKLELIQAEMNLRIAHGELSPQDQTK